jgi:hypothetical protein
LTRFLGFEGVAEGEFGVGFVAWGTFGGGFVGVEGGVGELFVVAFGGGEGVGGGHKSEMQRGVYLGCAIASTITRPRCMISLALIHYFG